MIRPFTNSMICYASTISEHPPNGAAKRIDSLLALAGDNAATANSGNNEEK